MTDPFNLTHATFTGPQTPEQQRESILGSIRRCEDARDFHGLAYQRWRLARHDKRHPRKKERVVNKAPWLDERQAERDAAKRERKRG